MFFGGLLVVALIFALVAPGFIDWSSYRSEFEKQAGKILGQKVEVLGEAKARLLPLPRITFTDVRVGARGDGEAMMVVDRFRVDAELAPLLKGEIVIVDMELQRPRVNIAIGENGVVDWTDRQSGGVNPDDVLLEKVTIRDGSIRLHNIATDQSFEAEQINVEISARTLAGPWRINGDLVLNSEKAAIKITTGRLQDSGTISTRLNIQPEAHPYAAEFAGPIGLVDGALNYKGNFKLRAVKPKPATSDGKAALTFPYEALPIRVTGGFDARPDTLKVSEFILAIGDKDDPYSITGTAQAAFGDRSLFKIVAEGQQIDVDRLGELEASNGTKPSLGDRLLALKKIADLVPTPPAEGLISLFLPAIVAGDTVIREVGVDILHKKDGWQLSNFDAGLPGRTRLQAHGLLTLGDNFGFKGQLLLASKQPSGFAGWLKGDVDPAIRRLPNAGFSAKVVINEKRILLQQLEVVLGATKLNGAFERVQKRNSRASLTTILDGKKIDFETLQALFLLFVSDEEGLQIADQDMDIKLLGEEFSAFGITAGSVIAALKFNNNNLQIDQLEFSDLAGADISVKGQIKDALNVPEGALSISLKANNPEGLLKLTRRYAGNSSILENLLQNPYLVKELDLQTTVNVSASGDNSNVAVVLAGSAGGTGIDLKLNMVGNPEIPGLAESTAELFLANVVPHILLQQLALPVLPLDVEGELQINAKIKGIVDKNLDASFSASLDQTTLVGKGQIDKIANSARRSRFDITLKSPDIDSMLLLSGYAFPGMQQGSSIDVSASITSLGSWLSAKGISGLLGGTPFRASLRLDQEAEPRPKISGNLSLDHLSLATVAALVMGEQSLEDGSSWSQTGFSQPVLLGLDAEIALDVKSVDLATSGFGYDVPGKNLTGKIELSNGDLAIREARIDWMKGRLAGEISFAHSQNNVLISTQLGIHDGTLSGVMWQNGGKPVTDGRFDLNLNIEGSGTSMAEIVDNLSGGGAITIRNGMIENLDPAALPAILENADRQPDEKLESVADGMIIAALVKNPFVFDAAEAVFSIAGGKLRASGIEAISRETKLRGDVHIDIGALTMEGNAQLVFDVAADAITGATPEIDLTISGPLNDPKLERQTKLLTSFLTMRARERKERAYEEQKEEILENQRLSRMVLLSKYSARAREKSRQQEKDQAELDEQAHIEQEILLRELEAAEEKARKARVAIQEKQRQSKDRRRQDELLIKQRQIEVARELEQQKADLNRRLEAFEKQLRELNAQAEKKLQPEDLSNQPPALPKLAAPKTVQPTGKPRSRALNDNGNLPGVFSNVEDKIGAILKNIE